MEADNMKSIFVGREYPVNIKSDEVAAILYNRQLAMSIWQFLNL